MGKRTRRKLNRQDAIYQLALAGISAAIALLFVWLSVLVRFSTVAFYVAASVAIMVPRAIFIQWRALSHISVLWHSLRA